MQQVHFRSLAGRHRHELQHRGATGHGFGDVAHQAGFLGPGQKPLARTPGRAVNAGADVVQDLRDVLYLVQDGGGPYVVEESLWIGPEAGHDIGILEQVIAGPGKPVLQHPRFSRAARSRQDNSWKAPSGDVEPGFQ